jgi:hypothetical protein
LLNSIDVPVVITILWTGAAVLIITAVLSPDPLIKRYLGVKRERLHTVTLKNQGNVPSVYQLSVASPEPRLKFRFLLRNIPLAEVPLAVAYNESEQGPTKTKAVHGKPSNGAVAQATKSGKAAARKTGEAASFLSAIGNLLPGKAGKALKQQGAAVRDVQTKPSQTMRVQDQAERQVSAVQRGSSKLGVKASIPARASGGEQSMVTTSQRMASEISYIQIAQTSTVAPGESLVLSLKISSPKKRIPEGSYLYTITSQQVPLEKVDRDVAPVTSQGIVHFNAVGILRYALPVLMAGLVIAGSALTLAYILTLIWA